ncbi:LuxR C-terminal-related transcriptional regulator [Arthrobacter sp. ISL-30]|uniref:LuxR C-terminal-related transcriptional regulator n=1 Tax=Arthrobacter sp. ISL-30 TaxID=2819109 RepID=UPI001BE5B16B|nr:LuxR family transcriptional regulator [Arthrobacter sp. ISL-30]MBT2514053.1 AAA family ATPase [Arthrobacter sp. ISL-30]
MDAGSRGLADVNPVRSHPLVGRKEYIDAAVGALRGGSTGAVLLVAEAGLGKSVLAESIASTLADEMIVMRVHGSPSLSNVPYGVLAPYLVDLPDDPTNSQIAILRAFWAQFERLRAGRDLPLLLVVDDAHELDEATANVIVDLITANWAKVVASCRPRPGLPPAMMQLWYDSMAERFELEPLTRQSIGEIIEHTLGAQVLASTVHMFWTASEGNPLILNCLIRDALEEGVLVRKDGVWLLTGRLTADGPALKDLVRNQLLRRTSVEREALKMIALAEPVGLNALEATAGADMVQALVESQLVAVEDDGETNLCLRYPVFGEAIRSMVSASRSLQLRQQLSSYVDRQPASEASRLRMVRWSLDAGMTVPERQLLSAARQAAQSFQNIAAVNLAARIHDGALRPAARSVAARAQFNAGRYTEALRSIEAGSHFSGVVTATAGEVLLQLNIQHCLGPGHHPPLSDIAVLRDAALQRESTDEAVRGLYALDLAGEFGLLGAALDELEEVLLRGAEGSEADSLAMFLLAMRSDVQCAQGDPVAAQATLEKAGAHLGNHPGELFFFPEFLMFRRASALLDAGEWREAERLLSDYEETAGAALLTFGGSIEYLRGISLFRQGRLDQSFSVLRPAVEALRTNDPLQLLAPALAVASYSAARSGEVQQAQRLLDQSAELGSQGTETTSAFADMFTAAARDALVRGGSGLAELRDILSRSGTALPASTELQGLSLWLELDGGEATQAIEDLTAGMAGRWAKAWNLYASARTIVDPVDCLDAAETIHGLGTLRLARDCFARAAGLYEAAGDRLGARQAMARRDHCERALGERPGSESQSAPLPAVMLTRRERDIVTLAVEGLTDRQIAERLMVSVRTVEGHLYRSYAKLGIRSREELRGAAGL